MIIRINKFYTLLIITFILAVSFILAMSAENKAAVASADVYIELPVIMYHHMTENESKAGNYTVTTAEFEADLKYLKSVGYSAVTPSELTDYVYSGITLPEKPIVLTFDDGFESYKALAVPILEKYDMKSAVFVIGSVTDLYTRINDHNISYSNLNWQQVKELSDSPICEVGSHTYDMHHNEKGERKGMRRLKGESDKSYKNAVTHDLTKLQNAFKEKNITAPTAIAYPYGSYDKSTREIVQKLGFKVSFTCEGKINRIRKGDYDCLYNLGRYNRESGISSENFFGKIINQER